MQRIRKREAYWYCADCGCYFSDEALTVEVSESDVLVAQEMVPVTEHTATGIWVTTKEATCAAAGTRVQYCKDCGTAVKTETIAKLTTHTYGEWLTTKEATVLAEGTMTRTCSVCGATETKAIAKLTRRLPSNPVPRK